MTSGSAGGSWIVNTCDTALDPSGALTTHLYCCPIRALMTGTVIVAVLQPVMPEAFHSVVFTDLKYH